MRFLKTNTATRITVGPFFDKTDGITPKTAITVTSCKLTLMVDDGGVPTLVLDTAPTASGGANDMVHVTGDDAGFYDLELAAGNVNYVGRAMLAITDAAVHCPVFHEFMILPANVYDSLVGGTDTLQADVTQWLGTAAATPTTAGVPEVDVTHVAGTAQTAGDLKASLNTIDDLIDTEVATLTTELAKVPKSDSNVSWNATALAAIQSEANDALVAYDPPTKAELDSAVAPLALEATLATVDNLIDTEISTLITMLTGIVPVNGTIGATGNSTTALHLDGLAWADDGPNSMLLTIQDVSTGLYYSRWIEDFATTGDLATVATLPFTPEASVDKYWLTPVRADVTGGSGLDAAGVRAAIGLASANLDTQLDALPTAAENRAEMDSNSTQLAAIVADTNELQTDDYPTTLATLATAAELAKVPKSDGTSSWNATALAAIQSEANDALVANRLDELMNADSDIDGAAPPTVGSVIHELMSKTAGSFTYDQTTDSLEAVRDKLTDIETDTAEIGVAGAGLTEAGGTGDHLTAVPWNAAWDAEVQSEVTDALNAYDPPTKTEMDTAFTEIKGATWDSASDTLEHIRNKETDIETDTADLQSRVPAALVGGRIDATVDATGMETGAIDAILTRAMTESYNTDGSTMTVAQALYLISQRLTEFAISGTTVTVKKLDGSTTALTLTLDDATSPTSSTRAS